MEEATSKLEVHLEEEAVEEDVTAPSMLSTWKRKRGNASSQRDLASHSDESDLEEGEVRDTEDLAEPHVFDKLEFKRAQHDSEEGELPDEAHCAQASAQSRCGTGSRNKRSTQLRKSLCSAWVLGSCSDVRCPHAHGYQAEMCPDLYHTAIWDHATVDEREASSGRPCVRGNYCSYAHSHKELQEMLESSVVHRNIDRVKIMPKLCAAELGKDRCVRGSACPFAHSTRELVAVLGGADIFRRVEREVYLQPDSAQIAARRSILCQHWMESRFVYTQEFLFSFCFVLRTISHVPLFCLCRCRHSDSDCEFAHGIDKSILCGRHKKGKKCSRVLRTGRSVCPFFHPQDVSEQLALVCPERKRPATLSPRTVFVAGILKTAQVADVHSLMEPFGNIEDVRIHEGKGSALVTFANTLSGVQAINILNLVVQIPGAHQPLTLQWSSRAFEEIPIGADVARETSWVQEPAHISKVTGGEIEEDDGAEEGEILGHDDPEVKGYSAVAQRAKPEAYCSWCFRTSGKKSYSHTEATCYANIRIDYQNQFHRCSTVQSVLKIVGKATEKGYALLHFVIAPAFCRAASVSSQPEDADGVVQVVEKLLVLVKGSIEQHEYDNHNICRKLSGIWWSLGTLSKQFSATLFHQFWDALNLLETETMRTGFWHPTEIPRKFEPRSFVMFLRAKVCLGRHSFISHSHEQAVKELVSQNLELFTTRDLCQTILGLILSCNLVIIFRSRHPIFCQLANALERKPFYP